MILSNQQSGPSILAKPAEAFVPQWGIILQLYNKSNVWLYKNLRHQMLELNFPKYTPSLPHPNTQKLGGRDTYTGKSFPMCSKSLVHLSIWLYEQGPGT